MDCCLLASRHGRTGHSYTLHRLVVSASSGRITQAWARYQLFDEIKASLLTDPSAAQPPDWDGRPFMHRLLLAQQRRRQAAAGADDSAAPLLQPPEGGPLLLPREYAAAPAPAGAAAAETSVLAPPLAVVHDFAVHAAKGLGAWAQLVDSSFAGLRDTYSGLTDDMHVWDAYGLWGATTTAEAGGRGGGGPGLLANASSRDEVRNSQSTAVDLIAEPYLDTCCRMRASLTLVADAAYRQDWS